MKVQLNASRWAVGASLLMATQLGVAGTMAGSKHDFTTSAWSGGRICIACHTTHNSDITITDAPLWSHKNSTAAYTVYSSPTYQGGVPSLGGLSKLCMSCHDGTVAIDAFMDGGVMRAGTGGFISTANNVGINLKDDHPVGFTYDATLATTDGSLFNPAVKTVSIGSGSQVKTGTIAAMMLYNGKMECSSCHDSHNTYTVAAVAPATTNYLLKMSPAASAICVACHNK